MARMWSRILYSNLEESAQTDGDLRADMFEVSDTELQVRVVVLEARFLQHDLFGRVGNVDAQTRHPLGFVDQLQNSANERTRKKSIR